MTWAEFSHWSCRFAESINLHEAERKYYLASAERYRELRDLLASGASESDWLPACRRALLGGELYFRTAGRFWETARERPSEFASALMRVWSDEPGPARLDELVAPLRALLPKVTPGNVTALGSLLLLAVEPEAFPQYRADFVSTWSRLVGAPVERSDASPAVRYGRLLDLCDELIAAAARTGCTVADRLDARGLAYQVLKSQPPASWTSVERGSFLSFRGDSPGQRAWLVRPKPHGSATVARWTDEGFVSLVAQYLGDVPAGAELGEVRAAVEKGYVHLDYAQRLSLASEYHAFLSRMKPEDLVATVVDDQLHVGVIMGEPEYSEDPDARLRHPVEWSAGGAPLAELAAPLPSLLDQQGTVVDLTAALGEVQRLAEGAVVGGGDGEDDEPKRVATKPAVPMLRSATDDVAASMHLPRSWLQEMIDLLQTRQQIVFYGPPGTGKTHVARELARHLVGADDPSRSRLVQFHPSYAYEDFFEGFRPSEGGSFVLTPGPLRDLAAAALAAPGEPFVLIIDEMNRANLAKVFGELYFLLEYRDQAIRLQYRPTEAFRLPPNLFLIGTMNTADRSIALVDAAIRRRFAFVELHPDVEPVRDLLSNFLTANKRPADPLVGLLRALNAQIEDADRDLRIGPTYLMRSDVSKPGGLERAWRYDLLPLLEEHYYGRYTREEIHRRFGLEALLGVVGGVEAAEVFDESAGPVGGPDTGVTGTGAGEV